MIKDPIIDEIHFYRKEYAARYGNDLMRMVGALKEKECASMRVRLNPGPKLLYKKAEKQLPKDFVG
uniref:Uncharacterized protein n=1 Tax=Candidatus Kentrum sp. MB TaxID=2138164 RepID=A0A451BCV4_9GAMM|nr:MAG: hypothetical protein BECKMB1821I_GA0114274_104218 [Candidatus Kentron sp. MB]VFK76112.1 MAG: hypothetical protein BECKMB1821H_GA0114242_104218 [Candidatus Kentron sp. MB]